MSPDTGLAAAAIGLLLILMAILIAWRVLDDHRKAARRRATSDRVWAEYAETDTGLDDPRLEETG